MAGDLTRRGFAGLSMAGFSMIAAPSRVLAAAQCVAPPMQPFLPNLLLIDCASRQNFRLFRQYTSYVGLTGVVSMTRTSGAMASYGAGSLMLFPWLKPPGQKLHAPPRASVPTGASTSIPAKPIPGATLPQDEYFCRFVLKAPWQNFIGFSLDMPNPAVSSLPDWRTDIAKLADGQGLEIDWTSSNLNRAWFGGSSTIPSQAICNGSSWRTLIVDSLNHVAAGAC